MYRSDIEVGLMSDAPVHSLVSYIRETCTRIPPNVLLTTVREIYHRLELYIQANEGNFKHLIRRISSLPWIINP